MVEATPDGITGQEERFDTPEALLPPNPLAQAFLLERGLSPLPSNELIIGDRLKLEAAKLKAHLSEEQPLKERLAIIHEWFKPQLIASGLLAYYNDANHNEGLLAQPLQDDLRDLKIGEEQLRNKIGDATEQGKFRHLEQRIADADALFNEHGDRIALALEAQLGKPIDRQQLRAAFRVRKNARADGKRKAKSVNDWDGTYTDDKKVEREFYGKVDPTLLGSRMGDLLHGTNRVHFPAVFVGLWKPLLFAFEEYYEEAGRTVPLRPGAAKAFAFAINQGLKPLIDTTNFGPFPRKGLEVLARETGLFDPNAVAIHGVTLDKYRGILSSLKGLILKEAALESDSLIIYCGDSHSDQPTLEATNVMAWAMAHVDGKYKDELAERAAQDPSLIYFIFGDGNDIEDINSNIFQYSDMIDDFFRTERIARASVRSRRAAAFM